MAHSTKVIIDVTENQTSTLVRKQENPPKRFHIIFNIPPRNKMKIFLNYRFSSSIDI